MIKSMTGYGKGDGERFTVEMRSVNHKYLDLSLKLPRDLVSLETRVKKAVGERFSRGRIEVFVTRAAQEKSNRRLVLDEDAAGQYVELLGELRSRFGLSGELDVATVSAFRDIFSEQEVEEDAEELWADISGPLSSCMDALDSMRSDEGAALAEDIRGRARAVSEHLDKVSAAAPEVVAEYAAKLKDRVAKIAAGIELDDARLAQEVAIFADRCDITEEVVRAKSHLARMDEMMVSGEPVGRKMDFLLQELNREFNTIGSKASDKDVAHRVVEVKAELEKIREQVQNIE